ncbi:T-complex protein 1 [Rhizoctonia solani]|uniref:T-complex protein 1 subunit gamma n=1 Tax=Rhizoctonia solani TaxID=456999 RepID=A0A8H7M068_9AGAM|nr:T-complex protein 1 [Rhizoctonia solani]
MQAPGQMPVFVMNTTPERQSGRKAQVANITAAKVNFIVPRVLPSDALSRLSMGGILLTNDGNAILREIDVAHPAAKNMIELSRTQDEEVGDGTTSVIILGSYICDPSALHDTYIRAPAGEVLAHTLPLLERSIHPVRIIAGLNAALATALETVNRISIPIDPNSDEDMLALIKTAIAVRTVTQGGETQSVGGVQIINGMTTIDIKRYARVEKVPGGTIEESQVLSGVLINKDITHPKMRRRIANPRIILLDCPLEYKKGESQTNIEISKEEDWARILEIEEEQIKKICEKLIEFKPDLIITEKGVSDLAQHYLLKANITALRRVRKSDNNRIARATGATIVNRVEDLRDSDVGTQCGMFYIEKMGDEYFTFLTECTSPKACTILLRGPSKDILNEIDRNLADAMAVARNVVLNPRLIPGGGAVEMAVARALTESGATGVAGKEKEVAGAAQGAVFKAVADALEVIPRTLVQNAGGNAIRVLTELRAKHAAGEHTWGIDGNVGKIADMKTYGLYESASVKIQTLKTAIEVCKSTRAPQPM